jgi:2-polyprenyl-3-methyl-5-hydroxy-6-metoxy-1,4-benzoquinol methylase
MSVPTSKTLPGRVRAAAERIGPLVWLVRAYWRFRAHLAPGFSSYLEEAVGDADTLLDVGCGHRSPIHGFRRRLRHTVGVDRFEPSIEESRALGIHDDYVAVDVLDIGERFEPNSFDAVVAFEVIEHFEEADALTLLAEMEKLALKRVVISTPNGFLPQGEYDDNPWQVHRSGWTPKQLRALGFEVRGIHGVKWLRTERSEFRGRPVWLGRLVSDLTQPLAARWPQLAFQLVCVKELGLR